MRFIIKQPVAHGRRQALVAFIDEWFGAKAELWLAARETGAPHEPFVEYQGAHVHGDAAVEASANRMPSEWLQELGGAVERSFSEVDHLRLGISVAGPTTRSQFKWVHLPRSEVTLRGRALTIRDVDISLYHVTVSQYADFMRETGYRPARDRAKRDGTLLAELRVNGYGPKAPANRLCYDDAVAYCQWIGFRLPSEAELYAFFLSLARDGHQLEWGVKCWTSDVEPDGRIVTCTGPYASAFMQSQPKLDNEHECHPCDHSNYPWIGFRVAKDD